MTVTHTPKLPNTRLLSGEWNAPHLDDVSHTDSFTFTLVDKTIIAPAVVPMEVDGIPCTQNTGFQSCRSGTVLGGAVNIGFQTIIAGCPAGSRIGFRLMINAAPSVLMLVFEPFDPAKKSACIDLGVLTFNQDDIIWVQIENLSVAPCTIRLQDVIGILNVRYDA